MSSRVNEYVKHAFLKVRLALAFCIIANIPPGKTAAEYVKELQDVACKKRLHDVIDSDLLEKRSNVSLRVERLAHGHLQRAVASQLSSLIPSSAASYQCTSNSSDGGYNSCEIDDSGKSQQSLFSDYEAPLNFSEDVKKTLNANLNFVHGLLRLQEFIENGDEVVGHTFETVVNQINHATSTTGSRIGTDMPDTGAVCRKEYRVASGVVEYALQTSNAKLIVQRSVQEIQRHLCGIALKGVELPYTIFNWEGSLLQHSITVVRKLSDEKCYQKVIVKSTGDLAVILITDMMKNYGLGKNMKLEYQATLLLQFCGNVATCAEVVNILIEKINMISSQYTAMHQAAFLLNLNERSINLECFPYLFYMTEKLLTRYFSLQQIANTSNQHSHKTRKQTKITELWSGAWDKIHRRNTCQTVPSEQAEGISQLSQSWWVCLENTAKVFSLNYPLISIYANHCKKIISVNQIN